MADTEPILAACDPRTRDRAPLRFAVMLAELTGAPVIVLRVQSGSSRRLARALQEAAEAAHATLLVGGATAARAISGSPCPLAVVPPRWAPAGGLRIIGVAFVDTEDGRAALRAAHALARRIGARLRVLTVVQVPFGVYAEMEGLTAEERARCAEHLLAEPRLEALGAATRTVGGAAGDVAMTVEAFVGSAGDVLDELSEEVDLLVCGSRGYGPVRGVLLGSVTRRLIADVRCPVILVPRQRTPLVASARGRSTEVVGRVPQVGKRVLLTTTPAQTQPNAPRPTRPPPRRRPARTSPGRPARARRNRRR
jgi:nucleotide-binding universal stress UspA family protein